MSEKPTESAVRADGQPARAADEGRARSAPARSWPAPLQARLRQRRKPRRTRRKKVPTGGTVTWALEQDPGGIYPFGATLTINHTANELMYDSLLEWDPKLNIKPALAESYDVVNSKRIVWNLRKGVQFHNGQEFTADDAKLLVRADPEPAAAGHDGDHRPGAGHRRRDDALEVPGCRWT